MDAEKYIHEISSLIARKMRGGLSEKEEERLEKWRKQSQNNEQIYRKLSLQENFASDYARYQAVCPGEDWQQILKKVKCKKRRNWQVFVGYAAVFMTALGISCWLWWQNIPVKQEIKMVEQEIVPGTLKAVLKLAGGKQISLDKDSETNERLLTQYGISQHDSILSYSRAVAVDEFHTLEVPRGGEYILLLEDGSKIWINAESVLKFPVHFTSDQRKIYLLQGEAYFRVQPDSLRPFRVETLGFTIEVTGTEFNVMAYSGKQQVETTLAKGSVRILTDSQQVGLHPGEQGVFSKSDGQVSKKEVDIAYYTSWKDGVFEFKDMPLYEVAQQLGRWYDVEFLFQDESLKNVRFTGAILKNKSLRFILDVIRDTRTVDYQIDERIVIVSQK